MFCKKSKLNVFTNPQNLRDKAGTMPLTEIVIGFWHLCMIKSIFLRIVEDSSHEDTVINEVKLEAWKNDHQYLTG